MSKTFAIAILLAAAAWGQDVQRTYHFANVSTSAGYQEIANVFRTVADLKDVSVDASGPTLTTRGTADQMALADWLFPQVDISGSPAPVSHEYHTTGPIPVVRVFYFAHTPSARASQEIVNVIRAGGNIARVVASWESRTLSVRATAEQVAAGAWLFSQLDVAEPSPGAATQSYRLDGAMDPEMRIVHLAHTSQPSAMQELVNTIRTIADMNRVFPLQASGIIMMRRTADYIAAGEWVLKQLDVPENQQGPAPHEQQLTDQRAPVAHVFYLSHASTPHAAQEIVNAVRTNAKVNRVYPSMQAKAVVLRGTPEQITQAAGIISEMDR